MSSIETARENYIAEVRALFKTSPGQVMTVYSALYVGTQSWDEPNVEARFENCLAVDSGKEPSSWTFENWQTCPHCNTYDNVLQPDSFMNLLESGEYVCNLCAEHLGIPVP